MGNNLKIISYPARTVLHHALNYFVIYNEHPANNFYEHLSLCARILLNALFFLNISLYHIRTFVHAIHTKIFKSKA